MGDHADSAVEYFINRRSYTPNKKKDRKKLANKDTITAVVRGKTSFCKLLPDQLALNYLKDGKEWSMDLQLSKEAVKDIKSYGIGSKIKTRDGYLDGQPYIRFTQKETNGQGEPNKPVEIIDILGNPWDDRRIGNGSVVDVKFLVRDYGAQKGVYIRKVRVLDHVPFEAQSTMPELSEDDEYFAKFVEAEAEIETRKSAEDKQFKKDFMIDDDVDDLID